MKKTMTTIISLLLLASAVDFAVARDRDGDDQGQNSHDQRWSGAPTRVRAPEISPAEAMGALALLGGAVAIVRGYRRSKNKK